MTENHDNDRHQKPEHHTDHHNGLYHWVYVFGPSVALVVIDLAFLWREYPEYHLLELLGAAALVAAPIAYEMNRYGRSRIAVSAVSIAIFALAVIAYSESNQPVALPPPPPSVPETEVIGELEPAGLPTPANGCDRNPELGKALKVLIGDNAVTNSSAPIIPLEIGGTCQPIVVERGERGLKIDATLYNAEGDLIAKITDNAFHALSSGATTVSREGNLSTLVVRDRNNTELLYVKYLNETTVRVRGLFGCPGHYPVLVQDDHPVPRSYMSKVCFNDSRVGIGVE